MAGQFRNKADNCFLCTTAKLQVIELFNSSYAFNQNIKFALQILNSIVPVYENYRCLPKFHFSLMKCTPIIFAFLHSNLPASLRP